GRFLESRRNGCPHDLLREGAAGVFLVAARRSVAAQRCRTLIPLISSASARGWPVFGHNYYSLRRPTTLLWSFCRFTLFGGGDPILAGRRAVAFLGRLLKPF
ncbi:hypothetical protein A2U01_0066028, partial [Trifolium medium]|nr:hypothetical protein [Trifolium medium]